MDKTEGIRVAIRVRPLNEREITSGQASIFRCVTQHNAITQLNRDGTSVEGQFYQYDKVFDEVATTQEVYGYIGSDIVAGVTQGINGTIFACIVLFLLTSEKNSSITHRWADFIRENVYYAWR